MSWYILAPIASSSPALTPDSTVIIQHGGQLKAIFSGNSGPARPWAENKRQPRKHGMSSERGIAGGDRRFEPSADQSGCPSHSTGSDSFSPNPGPMTYSWQCLEKPEGASVVITTPKNASATVRLSTHGIYRFRLTVSDDSGASSSDFVKIHCGLKWTAWSEAPPSETKWGTHTGTISIIAGRRHGWHRLCRIALVRKRASCASSGWILRSTSDSENGQ